MEHPPAMFVADAAGLDFLNSVATPADTQVDWIANGSGFLNWLTQAKLSRPTCWTSCKRALCRAKSTG